MTIYRNKAFRNICALTGVAILVAACATTHEDKESTLPCTIMQQSSRCAEVPMSDLQNEMVVKNLNQLRLGLITSTLAVLTVKSAPIRPRCT